MKEFLRKMWQKGLVDAGKLQSYCPIFLTEAEVEAILEVPQNGETA
ncbi:MAG: hypothetical protein ACOX64_02770 [Candidatus Merdivicinus sp.]|jgi:hypothetical protein